MEGRKGGGRQGWRERQGEREKGGEIERASARTGKGLITIITGKGLITMLNLVD